MATIPQRIRRALLGSEIQQLETATRQLYEAYLDGPFVLPPDQLMVQLREQLDSSVLQDMVNQLYWEQLAGYGYAQDESAERLRAVQESRRLWKYDPLTQWIVSVWTNFGFGENIEIAPVNEEAQEPWEAFWTADANAAILGQDQLQRLSDKLIVDGNRFLVFFIDKVNGTVIVRLIPCDEVQEIITVPEDSETPLFYRRQFVTGTNSNAELYYPDWRAVLTDPKLLDKAKLPTGAKRADEQKSTTTVVVMHVAFNRKDSLWGWPLMTSGFPWSRAHKQFRENRASVAAATAMYVNKLKYQGGSRAGSALKAVIQSNLSDLNSYYDSNPPATAGSTLLENQAAELTRLSQGTAAGDAQVDGEALAWMATLGGGLFPHWAGLGDAYRLATATAMEGPLLRQFSRYQTFWGTQFRRMVRIVLWADTTYGRKQEYEKTEAEVSTDTLVETDLAAYSGAAGEFFRNVLGPLFEAEAQGLISVPDNVLLAISAAVSRRFLQALNVDAATELTEPQAWGITPPTEERTPPRPAALAESHVGEAVARECPLCGHGVALAYPGHKGLLLCESCGQTYDPEVE